MVLQEPVTPPCKLPESAVMVTYSNEHLFSLLVLQRRAMEVLGVRDCLEKRMVTVCLDKICPHLCDLHAIPNCVDLHIETAASDFLQADYAWIVYIKHEIIEAAVQVAKEVFFVDTDTLIFNDPWTVNLNLPEGPYDLRYQAEHSAPNGCAAGANGGQIYVRQSNASAAYLANMKSFAPDILDGKHGLDQDFIFRAADAANAKRCALDPAYFIGHCDGSRVAQTDSKGIIVYHTNCVSGKEKMQRLIHFFKLRKAEKELRFDLNVGEVENEK